MRLLLILLLACGAWAQTDPIDERDAPQQLIRRWASALEELAAAHPNAAENRARRGRGVVHLEVEEDSRKRGVAVFGSDLTFKDAQTGEWQLMEPRFWTTQRGWVQTGTPVGVVVRNRLLGGSYAIQRFVDPDSGQRSWLALVFPRLTHVSDKQFSYTHNKHPWKFWLTNYGYSFASESVSGRRGELTFSFPYEASHAMRVDEAGDIVSDDSPLHLVRATMIGADEGRYPCGAWVVSESSLSFECDDSALPAEAFPYAIDPVATYYAALFDNNVNAEDPAYYYKGSPTSHRYTWRGNNNPYSICVGCFAMGYQWGRYNREMFFRWDTSSIPDNAQITDASVSVKIIGGHQTAVPTWDVSWYSESKWPIAIGANQSQNYWGDSANSVFAGTVNQGFINHQFIAVPLTQNLNQISLTGHTSVRFHAWGYTAAQNIFMDVAANGYGSLAEGDTSNAPRLTITYSVNEPPYLVSVSGIPAQMHYGVWMDVAARVGDPQGYGTLHYWHLLINYGVDGYQACYFVLNNRDNYLQIINDAHTDWGVTYTMGTANVASNSQCQVDMANSSFTYPNSTDVIANLRLRFMPNALTRNPMRSYLYALDLEGAGDGWGGHYSEGYVRPRSKLIVTSQR